MEVRQRLYGLDALRGLAGLSVVAYHYLREYGITFNEGDHVAWMDRYGHYGVEMFFIISGFVMYLTLERSPSFHRFLAARIARLAPGFYCCLAITTLVMLLHPLPPLPGPTPVQFLANLTMAPELFGQTPMDWSYWTLGYEFVFYAAIGTVFLCGWMEQIDWLCLAWLGFSAGLQLLVPHIPHRLGELMLISYGQFFVIGIGLCRFNAGRGTWLTGLAMVAAVLLSLFGASWRAPTPGLLYACVTAILTGIAWIAVSERLPVLIRVPLVWVSIISFPLFLIHQFVGYQIISALRAVGWDRLPSTAVAFVTSLTLAILVYNLVERPGRRWLRGRLHGRRDDAPQGTPALAAD